MAETSPEELAAWQRVAETALQRHDSTPEARKVFDGFMAALDEEERRVRAMGPSAAQDAALAALEDKRSHVRISWGFAS